MTSKRWRVRTIHRDGSVHRVSLPTAPESTPFFYDFRIGAYFDWQRGSTYVERAKPKPSESGAGYMQGRGAS